MSAASRPTPLLLLLVVTFLGSVSSGVFWAGIFFVTAERYHFSPVRNLALAAAMGAVYAGAAQRAGAVVRAVGRRLSTRAVLAATFTCWGLTALAPLLAAGVEAMVWASGLLGAAASALAWPIVESYMAGGRHGARMRTAIGWFNVTWTPATAVPLLVMPFIARRDVLGTLALSAAVSAAAGLLVVLCLPPRPGAHEREAAEAAVGREYPWLMRSASWLLPLSYVMSSTVAPVMPHRLAAVGVAGVWQSVVAATWMLARFATLAVMWRVGFWHGRWGTLAAAAVALAGGVAMVLVGAGLPMVVGGLVIFGTGMGLTYYAALYYALAVGHAAVDAGGSFEARIGLGYCCGPLLGLAGHVVARGPAAGSATVLLTSTVALLAAMAAFGPYREARRRR